MEEKKMLVQNHPLDPYNYSNDYYIPLDTEAQIRSAFGEWFCNAVGIDTLIQMQRDVFTFEDVFSPSFKIFAPTKGIRKAYPVPFIACTIEVYDLETHSSLNHVLLIAKHPQHPKLKHPELDSYGIYIKWSDTKEWELLSHLHKHTRDANALNSFFNGNRIFNYHYVTDPFLGMPNKRIQLAYVW
jgi:hypothetical protein